MNKPGLVSRLNEQAKTFGDIKNLLFEYIMNKEETKRRDSFEWLLHNITIMDLDTKGWKTIADGMSETKEMICSADSIAAQVVSSMVDKRVPASTFYDELWTKFTDDILLPSDEDKKCFLMSLWLDSRIPYFELDEGIEMSDDEYTDRIKQISGHISRAAFISSLNMDQKTKKASLLADEAMQISDRRDLAVFWAFAISTIEAKSEAKALQKLASKAESL